MMTQFEEVFTYTGRSNKPDPSYPAQEGRHHFSKGIVILTVISIYLYTATSLYFSWHFRTIPSELTVGYFSFWGVEMLALAYKHAKQRVAELRYDN